MLWLNVLHELSSMRFAARITQLAVQRCFLSRTITAARHATEHFKRSAVVALHVKREQMSAPIYIHSMERQAYYCKTLKQAALQPLSLSRDQSIAFRGLEWSHARFPSFRCRSSVAVSPFCRCKIPSFCKNYVRKYRSVTTRNSKKIHATAAATATVYGNGNG